MKAISVRPQPEPVNPEYLELPDRVAESLKDKTIFITGGSGLIGKVLLDKILRCCRGVKMIYLLVRTKKGKSGMERIDQLFKSPLFDLLKSDTFNDYRSKVRPIKGDVLEEDLSISPADRKTLSDEVNVVYHCASSVRFGEPFKRIVQTNVRGCKYMLKLANEMTHLEVYFHVSTAYAHTHQPILEERMYEPPKNPHDVLKLVDLLNEKVLDMIASKYIGDYPNSYGFTKALSEELVNEEIRRGKLPIVIIRPSVVIPLYRSPLPGWTDNMNGPLGLLIAVGKGVLRTMYMPNTTYADLIPVDVVVNITCAATYAYLSYPERRDDLKVMNFTTSSMVKITWREIIELCGHLVVTRVPFNWVPLYPCVSLTSWYYVHTFNFYLEHFLPAVIGDGILYCLRIKPVLMRIQRRISKSCEMFHYYMSHQWIFVNNKMLNIRDELLNKREKSIYYFDADNFDIEEYFTTCIVGARRYLMQEPDETLPMARKHMKVMWIVDKLFQFFLYYLIFSFTYKLFQSYFCVH